jgi:hypothetical protein
MPDRDNQVVAGEPSGGTWHPVLNPGTGWFASKTSGWTADSFSDGLSVDFSSVVPAGTKAVRVYAFLSGTGGGLYYRKNGDTNISNTPIASGENSHGLFWLPANCGSLVAVWLSTSYVAQFAIYDVNIDLYISYPVEYML